MVPDWLAIKLNPDFSMFLRLKYVSLRKYSSTIQDSLTKISKDLKDIVQKQVKGEEDTLKSSEHPTIFYELLQSDIPPQEKSLRRMVDEAESVIGGGLMTMSWALTIASHHIITNPPILHNLRLELDATLPPPLFRGRLAEARKAPLFDSLYPRSDPPLIRDLASQSEGLAHAD